MRNLVLFIATGAGTGLSPFAAGTVGSLLGLVLFIALAGLSDPALLAVAGGLLLTGTWAAGRAEPLFGCKDDGRITIDEVVGMMASLLWLPRSPEVWAAGFLLFRLFDIAKPPPVRQVERLGGGIGVMADDLVAALYANGIGQLMWRVAFPGGLP